MSETLAKELEVTGSLSPTLSIQGVLQKELQVTGILSKDLILTATIEQVDGKITGTLTNLLSLSGSLAKEYEITGNITLPVLQYTEDDYTGDYFIVPLAQQQTLLQTKGKRLHDNVVVDKIPFYQTSNLSGGYTAIIS